jgi:hypothetical protein
MARPRHDDELSHAIRENLEEKVADLIGGGMVREETERIAQREFSDVFGQSLWPVLE